MTKDRMWALQALALCLAALSVLTGCERSQATPPPQEDELVVFAAASLREVFTAMGRDFERAHPGVKVTFHFAGTQGLRTQLEHGAAADVFASADQRHMDELVAASRASAPVVLARNEPVLVVATEAAGQIHGLADLPSATRLVVGSPEVPIGRYTQQILERAAARFGADFRARVEARIVSRELNVRQVLAKVSLGEAEAGFVYRTDVRAAEDRVSLVAIPAELNVLAEYPIAVVTGAAHPGLARAWLDLVLSADGARALERAGFLAPERRGEP
ncbi:MAG: molybdate ABC transporter substrate-binding protein [Myxococcales bacterium]|nr:molybdate ABC transporter substrate-binding protein [Myxococcales bacterium]